jgi:hypothetical protein
MTILRIELSFSREAFAELTDDLHGVRRSLESGLASNGIEELLLWARRDGVIVAIGEGDADPAAVADAVGAMFVAVPPESWEGWEVGDPPDDVVMLPSAERAKANIQMAIEGDKKRCVCGGYPPDHYDDCELKTRTDERGTPRKRGDDDSGAPGGSRSTEDAVSTEAVGRQPVLAR